MPRRKAVRTFAYVDPVDEAETEQQLSSTRNTCHLTSNLRHTASHDPLPSSPHLESRTVKRPRTVLSSPLTPLGTSSSFGIEHGDKAGKPVIQQPRVSLARLPLDILHRVGQYLSPVFSTTQADGSASRSDSWTDYGVDLVRFSSTSRATWTATRHLVGRSFGIDLRASTSEKPGRLIERRLKGLVTDEEYDKARPSLRPRDQTKLSKEFRPLALHEKYPASRVRHLYLAVGSSAADGRKIFSQPGISSSSVAELFAKTLPLLTNLESLALIWKTEREVIATSPYSLAILPADILVALAAHPTLQSLFFCGVKFSRHFSDGRVFTPEDDSLRLQPSLQKLALNACHDSALELITMAKNLKEVRAHRDFARVPRVLNEFWWDKETWQTVERVDLTGFSSDEARELLIHWQTELLALRALPSPPPIPLHTLRLSEPYSMTTLRLQLLPTITHLPNLKSLAFTVWNERSYGPQLIEAVYEALPELEDLTVLLENNGLNWWPGSLTDYAIILQRFRNLRTFTWNYSPYADLDYAETRKHVHPMLQRSLLAPSLCPPSLTSLKWINESIYLRQAPPSLGSSSSSRPWLWSDHSSFEWPEMEWAVEALRKLRTLSDEATVGTWDLDLAMSGDEDEQEEEGEEEEGEWASEEGEKQSGEDDSDTEAEADDSDASSPASSDKENYQDLLDAGLKKPSNSPMARKPRLSIGQLLQQAKSESIKEGKKKAVDPPGDNEEGDDSGFFEMDAAVW